MQKYFVMPANGKDSDIVVDALLSSLWIRGQLNE